MNNSSLILQEQRNSSYKNGDVLKFILNDNIELMNPQETFFKFNLTVGTQGTDTGDAGSPETDIGHWFPWMLDPDCATEAFVESVRIQTKTGVVVEEIENYSLLAKKISVYTANETVDNMRKLYYGGDTDDVRIRNTLTSREDGTAVTTDYQSQENRTVECFLKLSLSGIMNGKQLIPVALMGGLEIHIKLRDDPYSFLMAQGQENGLGYESGQYYNNRKYANKVAGYSQEMAYRTIDIKPAFNSNNVEYITLDQDGTVWGTDNTQGTGAVTATSFKNYPFYNGQELSLEVEQGGGATVMRSGVIKSIEHDTPNNRLKISFETSTPIDFTNNTGDDGCRVWVKIPTSKPTVNFDNFELVVGQVKMNKQTIGVYEKAVNSGEGLVIPFHSWVDYPVNSSAGALQISNLVNCKLSKVKGLLSFWENVSDGTAVYEDNLQTPNNDQVKPKRYSLKLNGLQVPSRKVDFSNFQRPRSEGSGWSMSFLRELKQMLKECGYSVRSLAKADLNLMIGRAFTRKPNNFSMADLQGELRVELEFDTNNKNLLHHNFICCVKDLVVKSNSNVEVLE